MRVRGDSEPNTTPRRHAGGGFNSAIA